MRKVKILSAGFKSQIEKFQSLANQFIRALRPEFKLSIKKTKVEIPGAMQWVIVKKDSLYMAEITLYSNGTVYLKAGEVRHGGNSSYFMAANDKPKVFKLTEEDAVIKIVATLKALQLE